MQGPNKCFQLSELQEPASTGVGRLGAGPRGGPACLPACLRGCVRAGPLPGGCCVHFSVL